MKYIVSILIFSTLITACSVSGENEKHSQDIDYSKMLGVEIERLKASAVQLEKTIYYRGKTQAKLITHPIWKTELQPFTSCNILTPGFDKLYTTVKRTSGDSLFITYSAKTEKSEIRKLELLLLQNNLETIRAELYKKNSYFTLNETLHYSAQSGYVIKGTQKMMFAVETVYCIQARFIKPS